ncbi:hypothetical protein MPNT_440007 [Candidatus Methylacidithermus pantelleriae]|uniref:Uncharacterized protein n=1 Tax=Candidatus Methylacidithermus pantelleriae TaxID=2744239 RepID=A0A8J2BL35_9BACT|nr:hypothetical protein MPNT_440007 [Candidatus Methylacidithermus pantelleriae]
MEEDGKSPPSDLWNPRKKTGPLDQQYHYRKRARKSDEGKKRYSERNAIGCHPSPDRRCKSFCPL